MRRAGHVACTKNRRGAYGVLVGRHEMKRSLGRPRRRWEDKIKMDLRSGVGGYGMDLTQDSDRLRGLLNAVLIFRLPKMRGIN